MGRLQYWDLLRRAEIPFKKPFSEGANSKINEISLAREINLPRKIL